MGGGRDLKSLSIQENYANLNQIEFRVIYSYRTFIPFLGIFICCWSTNEVGKKMGITKTVKKWFLIDVHIR